MGYSLACPIKRLFSSYVEAGVKRILWMLVWLAALSALTYHLKRQISAYIEFGTSTEIQVKAETSLPFPG